MFFIGIIPSSSIVNAFLGFPDVDKHLLGKIVSDFFSFSIVIFLIVHFYEFALSEYWVYTFEFRVKFPCPDVALAAIA